MNIKNIGLMVLVLLLLVGGLFYSLHQFSNPARSKPPGLVALWAGKGNLKDSVTGLVATSTNVTFARGKVGRAYSFDGSSSWIHLPASPALDVGPGAGFTIECWIKPSAFDVTVSGAPIIEWDSDRTDGLQLWSGGEIFANLKDTSGIAHTMNVKGITLDTNVFQHLALTYDRQSGNATIYYNGQPVNTQAFGDIVPQTTYPVNIGRRTGQVIGLNDTYGGLIDGLSIYNRALSPAEIQSIYQKSK